MDRSDNYLMIFHYEFNIGYNFVIFLFYNYIREIMVCKNSNNSLAPLYSVFPIIMNGIRIVCMPDTI